MCPYPTLLRLPLSCLLLVAGNLCLAAPELWVELGAENRAFGLSVPSAGDGVNTPVTVDGSTARRFAKDSGYLYVRIEHPDYAAIAPVDLYVSVELADDDFHQISLQYDHAAQMPNLATKYTAAAQSVILTGRGGWQTACFVLPQCRVGHGQNNGTDFRLAGTGVTVRRIRVAAERPGDFRAAGGVSPASLEALRTARPPGVELTLGSDANATEAAMLKALSVTSIESYVHWAGVEPDAEGEWDWSKWDAQVDILREHGLKWVPFLIAGPAYATPLWFQRGPDSHYFRCLEHNEDSKVQSIFSPSWPAYVRRFLEAFAERYRDTGVIESVLLGVTGIYGESIYPAGPQGGWTAGLTGPYHNHEGWWLGDDYARQAFRRAMRRRYWFTWRLNQAWGTKYRSFDHVETFLPAEAPSDRARADLAEWYQQAMTDWAVMWVKAARKCFPNTEIYLCTGGNGRPVLGADFTAQAKAIAPYGAGIRITNEASDYAHNFTVTREVATATRLYHTFAGFEPAGNVDANGVAARIYNATASGARQLHYYKPNILSSGNALHRFQEHAAFLVPRQPVATAGLYLPREGWAVAPEHIDLCYENARLLRDLTDYRMLTHQSIQDGGLAGCRWLLLADPEVLDPQAADNIADWVRDGGILVIATRPEAPPGSRLGDLRKWRRKLLPPLADTEGLYHYALRGEAPPAWQLRVGTEADAAWLFGDWYHREEGNEWNGVQDARKRWSGRLAGIRLPVLPGAPYTLRLDAHLSGHSLAQPGNIVRVNGREIGRLDEAGTRRYTFHVPAGLLGNASVARLEITMNTWSPRATGESQDARELGVALRQVEWFREGSETIAPGEATLEPLLDAAVLSQCCRSVGDGCTVYLPGWAVRPAELARVLGVFLRQTDRFLVGVSPLAPVDGHPDERFATRTNDAVLWYDGRDARIIEEGASADQ